MAFVDPFRVANYINGAPLYRWEFLSELGGHLRSSNGTLLQTAPMQTISTPADYTIVSASWTPEAHVSATMKARLRAAKAKKQTLGALDTGAFVLAHCGVLEGYQATVHYEHIDAFQELFPNIAVSEALWVMDRDRITCCGGMATAEFAMRPRSRGFPSQDRPPRAWPQCVPPVRKSAMCIWNWAARPP
jgi:AraC family carnitine catabolism transcriptional activator